MKGVGVVVIVGLVDAVLEPAAAAMHQLQAGEKLIHNRTVGGTTVTVLHEEFQDVDSHEIVVVVDDAVAPRRAEPAGDEILVVLRERSPKLIGSDLERDGEQADLDVMLMVVCVGAPILLALGIGADHQARPKPGGDFLARSLIVRIRRGLQPMGCEQERTGEGLQPVGLEVVVAGGAFDVEVGATRLHEGGERFEQPAGGVLPVTVGFRYHGCGCVGMTKVALFNHAVNGHSATATAG